MKVEYLNRENRKTFSDEMIKRNNKLHFHILDEK